MFISLLLSTFLGTAHAVPLQLTQQGRVLDNNGAAVTGIQDLTFRIYDASTGGSVYWSETVAVNFNNGYYATVLGADEVNNALDSSTLSLYPLYLEVQLNNNAPMSTRYAINSAPYAQMAGNAEVATAVDGGSVNATEVSINASQVIDGNGNWVGQPITVDWNNIDPNTIPSYIADGDDNTQLSESQVEQYVTNDVINLAAGSQVGGSDIVTVATDSDTLAGLSCTSGEIAGWNGSAWTCVSDNTLSVSDVSTMLTNNAVDLNVATTIGGLTIITEIDDSDTLANLSCANDGEIARYDIVSDEWYCDTDIDTVLDENTVETYVTNGAIDLDANTTIDGNPILTTITDSDVLAALGCNDGEVAKYDAGNAAWTCGSDDNTQLSQSEVLSNVTGQQLALGAGTTVGGSNVLTQPSACADGQVLVYNLSTASWACGADTDTTLSASEVQAMVEAVSGLALQAGTTVGGSPLLTEGSTIGVGQLDGTSGSSGQVLTTDGSTVSWEDSSGGCQVMNSFTSGGTKFVLQCGTESFLVSGSGVQISSFANSMLFSEARNCAIDTNNEIVCWGLDNYGQTSDIPSGQYSYISSGEQNSCAINLAGTIECWGSDSYGEVSSKPNGSFTEISSGSNHHCARTSTDQIECWGLDNTQQVINAPSGQYQSLSSGQQHNCALDYNGNVTCWGDDTHGLVSNTPLGNYGLLSSGYQHTCGLTVTGTIDCWGLDNHGQVTNVPVGLYTTIESGFFFSCALDSNGNITCWGSDNHGIVTDSPSGQYTSLTAGYQHVCALSQQNTVACWGNNTYTENIPSGLEFTEIKSSKFSTCGLTTTSNVVCWGNDSYGQVSEVP